MGRAFALSHCIRWRVYKMRGGEGEDASNTQETEDARQKVSVTVKRTGNGKNGGKSFEAIFVAEKERREEWD